MAPRRTDSRIGQYASLLQSMSRAMRSGEGDLEQIVEEAEQVKAALPEPVEAAVFVTVLAGGRRCQHDPAGWVVYSRADRPERTRLECRACLNQRTRRRLLKTRGKPLTPHQIAVRANRARWDRVRAAQAS